MEKYDAEHPLFTTGASLAAGDSRVEAAWFRAAFAASPTAMALLDLAGRLRETNPAAQRFLGYSDAELRGRSLNDWTHPDDVAEGRRLFRELAVGLRDRYAREKRYIRKDGRVRWGWVVVLRVPGPAGEASRILALVEDLTARREATVLRQQMQALCRAVVVEGQRGLPFAEGLGGEEAGDTMRDGTAAFPLDVTRATDPSTEQVVAVQPRLRLSLSEVAARFIAAAQDAILAAQGGPRGAQLTARERVGALLQASMEAAAHAALGVLAEHTRHPPTPPPSGVAAGSRPALTPREGEILAHLAAGRRNAEIAAMLAIKERTVEYHVGHLLNKLEARTRTEAVHRARLCGLPLSEPPPPAEANN